MSISLIVKTICQFLIFIIATFLNQVSPNHFEIIILDSKDYETLLKLLSLSIKFYRKQILSALMFQKSIFLESRIR